jgi:hypothetical protein
MGWWILVFYPELETRDKIYYYTLILRINEKLELIPHDLVLFWTNALIWMKSMPYSALVLELVQVFETSARTSLMTSYNAAFQIIIFFI